MKKGSHGNKVRTYDVQHDDKETVQMLMRAKLPKDFEPLTGPLTVTLSAYFQRPKARNEGDPHIAKPDLDNIIKFYLDCANGVIWRDDSQVVAVSGWKEYAERGRVCMTVTPC